MKRSVALMAAAILVALVAFVSEGGRPALGATTATPHYPVGNIGEGFAVNVAAPTSSPPGVNVPCHPSSAHPYPVVLVPGTFASDALSWQALGPVLANAGYCVYGLNYGQTPESQLFTGGRITSVGDIPTSAGQLGSFVSQVRSQTGAAQVDLVGWSQGGMMPRWYMNNDGGAKYVHKLVGLAPSNHGTTIGGFSTLVNQLGSYGLPLLSVVGCEACTQQMAGSSFMQQLNAGGDATPGVAETVIETKYDDVVTPYTSAFLQGAHNIALQDQCPLDGTDHIGIGYDSPALQDVVNTLGPDNPSFAPNCDLSLPLVGTP